MSVFRECGNYETCKEVGGRRDGSLHCEGCHTYKIYKKGFDDGVKALASELNRLAEKVEAMPRSE